MSPRRAALAIVAAALLATRAAEAQWSGGLSVEGVGTHVWRGVRWSDAAMLRSSAHLGFGDRVRVAAGGWVAFELEELPGTSPGIRAPGTIGVAETDAWAELRWNPQALDVRAGVVHYGYATDSLRMIGSSGRSTTEAYLSVHALRIPLSPRAAVWYDVDEVDGAFVDLALTHSVGLLPSPLSVQLDLGLTAGASLSQAVSATDPGQRAYAAGNGVTYLDLMASVARPLGPFIAAAAVHYQRNFDAFTKRVAPPPGGGERGHTFWIGLSLSWVLGGA